MSTQEDLDRIGRLQEQLEELRHEIQQRHETMMAVSTELQAIERRAKFGGQEAFTVEVKIEAPAQRVSVFAADGNEALEVVGQFMNAQLGIDNRPDETADDSAWEEYEATMNELHERVTPEDGPYAEPPTPSYTLSLAS